MPANLFEYVYIGDDTRRIYKVTLCDEHRYLVRNLSGGERIATFTDRQGKCNACFITEHADKTPTGDRLLAEARQVSIFPDVATGAFNRLYQHAWNTGPLDEARP